ncbi:hypothetical protein HDU84_007020 [Entophlyctis sp. JEL0112]|nr:hypothetical protein HDU84_007020 [Entophlyctis sp. JEL0112]
MNGDRPHVFLDQKCLNVGEDWERGFVTGLSHSNIMLALLSLSAMRRMMEAHEKPDNVLLEWEIALELENLGHVKIQPIFLGEWRQMADSDLNQNVSVLVPFKCSLDEFPNLKHCHLLSPGKRTIREIVAGILKFQAIAAENPRNLRHVVTECRNVLTKKFDRSQLHVENLFTKIVHEDVQLETSSVELLVDWLDPLKDEMTREQSRLLSDHIPGTRSWLLGTVMEFLDPNKADEDIPKNRVLWLKGQPGVGKSVMSALVADELRQRNLLGAVFYAKHDNEKRNSAKNLITTLAFGLCEWSTQFSRILLEQRSKLQDLSSKSLSELFKSLISNPLEKLFEQSAHRLPVVIVVDALDECGKMNHRAEILDIFSTHCAKLPENVKVFVTSRMEDDIVEAFAQLPTSILEPSSEQNQADALLYAQYFLKKHSARADAIELGPGVLVEKSCGVFLWLVVACKTLDTNSFEEISLEQIQEMSSGSKLDTTVDDLYHSMLSRAFDESEASSDLFHVLATIVIAFEPLTIQTVSDLLSIDLQSVKAAVRKLDSLLLRDGDTNKIRVFHKSVKDYLTDATRCMDTRFSVVEEVQHGWMAVVALRYLNAFLRFNMCELPHNVVHADFEGFAAQVRARVPAAAAYAATYFQAHGLACDTPRFTELLAARGSVLEEMILHRSHHWMELLSLVGRFPLVVSTAVALRARLAKVRAITSEEPGALEVMLRDLQRVGLRWLSAAQASALQVYIVAAVFAPSDTAFAQAFGGTALANGMRLPATVIPRESTWDACVSTLEGQQDRVSAVAVSAKGSAEDDSWDVIATSSLDGSVHVWDLSTGVQVCQMVGHEGLVRSVDVSADGFLVVSGSEDNSVRVWNARTGVERFVLYGNNGGVYSVTVSRDGWLVLSGSGDGSVTVWKLNVDSKNPWKRLEGHSDTVMGVALSMDSSVGVSGSQDKTIRIWNMQTGEPLQELLGHSGTVNAVTVSSDGRLIVSCSSDKTIRIWDVNSGDCKNIIEGHTDCVRDVSMSASMEYIVSGSLDKTVKVWDAKTFALRQTYKGHVWGVSSVAITSDGNTIISGSHDKTAKIWDKTLQQTPMMSDGHSTTVNSVFIHPSGSEIVSGSDDATVKLWDVATGKLVKTFVGHFRGVNSVVMALTGAAVVSGSSDGSIILWDKNSGAILGRLEGHTAGVNAVVLSSDAKTIVSGSYDKTVRLWNSATGAIVQKFDGHATGVTRVGLSRDEKYAISMSLDDTICIWDLDLGTALYSIEDSNVFPAIVPGFSAEWTVAKHARMLIEEQFYSANGTLLFLPREFRSPAMNILDGKMFASVGVQHFAVLIWD